MVELHYPVTQQQFGELVGISQQAVSDLLKGGILSQGGTAAEWLLEYCDRLREQAAGRAAAGDLDLAAERAGLARAQREKIEMQNAETKRELAPVYLLEDVLARAGARAGKILDTIPGVIHRREPSLSAETIKAISADIAKVRNIAASMTLAQLFETEPGEPDGADEGTTGEAD